MEGGLSPVNFGKDEGDAVIGSYDDVVGRWAALRRGYLRWMRDGIALAFDAY